LYLTAVLTRSGAKQVKCVWVKQPIIVPYTTETSPGVVAVPVGAFADPSFPAPTKSVWEERRRSWLRLPDDIEHVS
jgi:hypothetical protein